MCGIVGLLSYGDFKSKKKDKIRLESMVYIVSELLTLTQSRGKDATGMVNLFSDGHYTGFKMGISAQEFTNRIGGNKDDYEGYLNAWREYKKPAKIVLGHCRKPTISLSASASDNNNNHPIKVGDIIGVHNGTLTNYEEIFKKLSCDRSGEVDSEAIFRLLYSVTNEGKDPFTEENVYEACIRMNGASAFLALNGNNPYQLACYRDTKPIEFALIKPLKLLLIASEKEFLQTVVVRYNRSACLYRNDNFMRLKKGDIEIKALEDDTLCLLDTRDDITEDTGIDSLIHNKKKVTLANKIWKKSYNPGSYGGYGNRHSCYNNNYGNSYARTPYRGTPVTNLASSKHNNVTNSTSSKRHSGMAWSREAKEYLPVSDIRSAQGCDTVEVKFANSGIEVINARDSKTIAGGEKKVSNGFVGGFQRSTTNAQTTTGEFNLQTLTLPPDNGNTTKASIEDVSLLSKEEDYIPEGDVSSRVGGSEPMFLLEAPKEVDVTVYPHVMEAAENAAREVENFSSNEELCAALDIKNTRAVANMQSYSLGNRIKKYFYKLGWYDGYKSRLEESNNECGLTSKALLNKVEEKMARGQRTIRHTKNIAKVLSTVVETAKTYLHISDSNFMDNVNRRAVHEAIKMGLELDPKILRNVFKPGDVRDNSIIGDLISKVEEQSKKK